MVHALIFVAIMVAVIWYVMFTTPHLEERVNGVTYKVTPARDQKKAAQMLHRLAQRLQRFIDEGLDIYPDDTRLQNLKARWSGTLSELNRGGDIAYSLNKKNIHICIRKADGGIESEEVAMYVLLHEAAHVATKSYGHSPVYWKNFQFMLELAEKLGVYIFDDFTAKKTTYCGHTLGKNVIQCVKKKTCRSLLT